MMSDQRSFAQLMMAALFSIALAVTGCSSSDGGAGSGGDGGSGGVGGDGGSGGGGSGGTPPPDLQVTATPAGTTFDTPFTVTLEATGPASESATIYYTTDLTPVLDDEGNVQGTEYDGTPIPIDDTTVLKFLAGVPTPGAGGAGGGPSVAFSPEDLEGYTFADTPIREQWANSGHGDITSGSWRRWDGDGAVPARCAKCHGPQPNPPSTGPTPPDVGFLEYLTTGETPTVDSPPPLGIDCVNCHQTFPTIYSNLAKFGLPGGALEPVPFPSEDTVSQYGPSNICMTCHQGRQSGENVRDEIEADDGMGPYTFLNIHYYTAAATVFGNEAHGGFEYDGNAYRPRNTFPSHPESFSTCVGCHMQNAENNEAHTWIPEVDSCIGCHGGSSLETLGGSPAKSYDILSTLTPELYAEIQRYADEVIGMPIVYADGYPYFFNDNGEPTNFGNRYTSFDATLLPAAYNYQVIQKDPFGYIHNGGYLQQLAFDSIVDLGGTPSVVVIGRGGLTIDGEDIGSASETEQWWISAHGALDTAPFRHWDDDYLPDGYTPEGIPGRCSKCHSTGGFEEYAAELETTAQLPMTGVDCWSCHNNFNLFANAETRYDDLGTNPALEDVVFPSGLTASFDNASNICMACHQGRASRVQVDEAEPNGEVQSPTNYDSYDFVNIHYYATAATLFGTDVQGGYEYAGETYRSQNTYVGLHNPTPDGQVLVDCVGCHLNSAVDEADQKRHTFMPQVEDCNQCHSGQSFQDLSGSPADNYREINLLLDDLIAAIQDYAINGLPQPSGVFYDGSSYPYWFKEGGPAAYPNRYRDFDFDMLTAAYNYQVGLQDEGGYMHNGGYIQQLLFDSICLMGGTPSVVTVPTRPATCP